MYCGAFKRLAGVTQVASPINNISFHTRLTHSFEVAQIGRRIAETLAQKIGDLKDNKLPEFIDPDIVEAAAFIHDLGHPPFGHIAEEELNKLVKNAGDKDGFDANAQSFRIVTRLSAHRKGYYGLDLCRATLNASLKYPWFSDSESAKKSHGKKYGVYHEDESDLYFAREGYQDSRKCLEAEILDYADDVAYSVHDIEDFYRAGLLPLDRLLRDQDEMIDFIEKWKEDKEYPAPDDIDESIKRVKNLLEPMLIHGVYTGSFSQRAAIRVMTSGLIKSFIEDVEITKESDDSYTFKKNPSHNIEISFLQRAIWHYLISDPKLTTQQKGHIAIIRILFNTFYEAIYNSEKKLIPGRFHHVFDDLMDSKDDDKKKRLAADIVSSLTDYQAMTLAHRLTGQTLGSLSDIIVW